MRIVGLTLHPEAGWPGIEWPTIQPGLNAIYGARATGKTSIWQFLAHVLYGRHQQFDVQSNARRTPDGEIVVEHDNSGYRLRRCRDEAGTTHLTIAAVEEAPVDRNTLRGLLHGISPRVLSCLYAVSFETVPDIGRLLGADFARDIESITGPGNRSQSRRLTELAARRDLLAQELEKRIAGDRRVSQELDVRWQELDRRVREEHQRIEFDDERLRTIDAALAETDARLRYRRLELNTQLQLHADGATDVEPQASELDHQISKWRNTLSEISERQSALRARLAQLRTNATSTSTADVDQRTWLAMSRQLTADLAGEVARLARAAQSQQCVCRDAHPRLRPISESIQRQLDLLQSLLQDQQTERHTAALQQELDQLCRVEDEARRHVDGLLDRRQSLQYTRSPVAASTARNASDEGISAYRAEAQARIQPFSAADAEQLERRRLELEEQRYTLVERLRTHAGQLRDLRAQRDTVERQRAALLSARSIEHVQRELADVQRKLQLASGGLEDSSVTTTAMDNPVRASDFLAQLTDGELVRLALANGGRLAEVVNRAGEALRVESLAAAQADQVYLSLCLALVSSAAQRGIVLPMVLDDPFARLDAKGTAAMATVLADFCRQGHQLLIFTEQQAAAERLVSVGGHVHNIADLRKQTTKSLDSAPAQPVPLISRESQAAMRPGGRATPIKKRRKKSSPTPLNGKSSPTDRSDAA